MTEADFATVVVAISTSVDRTWIRQLTARMRDLPGVESVTFEVGRLEVSGRLRPSDVWAVVHDAGPLPRGEV